MRPYLPMCASRATLWNAWPVLWLMTSLEVPAFWDAWESFPDSLRLRCASTICPPNEAIMVRVADLRHSSEDRRYTVRACVLPGGGRLNVGA